MRFRGGAGRLRHRIDVDRAVETIVAGGDVSRPWTTLHSAVPASIEPVRAEERTDADKVEGKRTHVVRVRGGLDIKASDRVVFGSRVFHIDGVRDIFERGAELHLSCVEVT